MHIPDYSVVSCDSRAVYFSLKSLDSGEYSFYEGYDSSKTVAKANPKTTFSIIVRPDSFTVDIALFGANQGGRLRSGEWKDFVLLEMNATYALACTMEETASNELLNGYTVYLKKKRLWWDETADDLAYGNWTDLPLIERTRPPGSNQVVYQMTFNADDSYVIECGASRSDVSGIQNRTAKKSLSVIATDIKDESGNFLLDIVVWDEKNHVPLYTFDQYQSNDRDATEKLLLRVYKGDSLVLACRTQRVSKLFDPYAVVQWFYIDSDRFQTPAAILSDFHPDALDESIEIVDREYGLIKSRDLKFSNLSKHLSGMYGCTNAELARAGYMVRILYLEVTDATAPFFQYYQDYPQPKMQASYGKSYELSCRAQGDPPPTIEWIKNGKKLSNAYGSVNLSFPVITESDEGDYSCLASSRFGSIKKDASLVVTGAPISLSKLIFLGLITLLTMALLSIALLLLREHKKRKALVVLYSELKASASYDPSFEIDKEQIKIQFDRMLGEGTFGQVFLGQFKPSVNAADESVAVKLPKDGKDPLQLSMLLEELKIMMTIGKHCNILALKGAHTSSIIKGELFVVVEFCSLGNMEKWLKNAQLPKQSVGSTFCVASTETNSDNYHIIKTVIQEEQQGQTSSLFNQLSENVPDETAVEDRTTSLSFTLLSFAFQTANGMIHLKRKLLIHRDLAARNLLLVKHAGSNVIVVKIADYGLARQRDTYHISKNECFLPMSWMAPESLTAAGEFTNKTDVWSFGVVMWEIFSLGENPEHGYSALMSSGSMHNFQEALLAFIRDGGRLERPTYASTVIFQLMNACWEFSADERPAFEECMVVMKAEMESRCKQEQCEELFGVLSNAISSKSAGLTNAEDNTDNGEMNANEGEGEHSGGIISPNDIRMTRINSATRIIDFDN